MTSSLSTLSVLFEPVQLGALQLRNRIVVGAMTRNRGVVPAAVHAKYYGLRAQHAGLIITEAIQIVPQGSEWPYAPGLFNEEQVAGWRLVTDAVHREGGLIVAQLWHLGRTVHPLHQAGQPGPAPSAVRAKGGKFRLLPGQPGYQMPRAIDDPEEYVQMFHKAALAARRANFDGVELLGGGGYLAHQFLDPTVNHRDDQWGGTIDNRSRFMLRVTDELIHVWGADRVGVRLQPAGGFNDMGWPRDDTIATYKYLLAELDRRSVAWVEFLQYLPFLDPLGRGLADLDPSRDIAPFFSGSKMLNGGFDEHSAARAIREGLTQTVSFGRPFLANPDLPAKWKRGLPINDIDWSNVYTYDEDNLEKGFLDYPLIEDLEKGIAPTGVVGSERTRGSG